jgi:deoxycytidylate deaminase
VEAAAVDAVVVAAVAHHPCHHCLRQADVVVALVSAVVAPEDPLLLTVAAVADLVRSFSKQLYD